MTTIRELASELNAQPYEIAAYGNISWPYDETAQMDPEIESAIRESWEQEPKTD